jgi:UDP-N-acetylmuramoyl-tripeptide--D-alanyl-D-alanine ligase
MVEAAIAAGMKATFVVTPEEAGEWLVREAREGDVVLLKASRGVKLERALEAVVGHQSVVGKSKAADERA